MRDTSWNENPRVLTEKMSRRKAFQVVSLLAKSVALTATGLGVRELASEEKTVATALEKYLGISPDENEVQLYFANHVITPKLDALIQRFKPQVLLGELTEWDLSEAALKPAKGGVKEELRAILYKLQHPGAGVSPSGNNYHDKKVLEYKSAGTPHLIPTDSPLSLEILLLIDKNIGSSLSQVLPLAVLTSMVSMPMMFDALFVNENGEIGGISRREFLKRALTAILGVGLYAVLGRDLYQDAGAVRFGSNLAATNAVDSAHTPSAEEPWLALNEAVVSFRNCAMALNTLSVIANRTGDKKEKTVFYAGNGHRGVLDEMQIGPEKLERKIKEYCARLLTTGSDQLWKSLIDAKPSAEDIENNTVEMNRHISYFLIMKGFANMFSSPRMFDAKESIPLNTKAQTFPSTLKSLFLAELQTFVESLEESYALSEKDSYESVRYEALGQVLRDVTREIVQTAIDAAGSEEPMPPYLPEDVALGGANKEKWVQSIASRMKRIDEQLLGTKDTKRVSAVPKNSIPIQREHFNFGSYTVFMGLVEFRGRLVPMMRRQVPSEDNAAKIFFNDMVLVDGHKIPIAKQVYTLVTTQEQRDALDTQLASGNFSIDKFTAEGNGDGAERMNKLTHADIAQLPGRIYSYTREESTGVDPLETQVIYFAEK